MEPHVHCAECFREISTKVRCKDGKTKDVHIGQGTQFVVVPGPQGLGVVPRMVPLCPDCHETINKQAKAASKLIVPQMSAPKLKTVQ